MSILVEDFGAYADTADMLGTWSVTDPNTIGEVTLSTDHYTTSAGKSMKFHLSGLTPPFYPYPITISRTVTGLAAGSTYRFAPQNYIGGSWSPITYLPQFNNFSATVTADLAGEATIFLAPGIAAGSPTATYYFDGLYLIPSTSPWDDILLDAGVVTVAGAVVGFTTGGLRFELERKFQQRAVEGVTTPVAGLEYVASVHAKFVGTIVAFTAAARALVEPGATTETEFATTTYTPIATRTDLVAGQYCTNVAVTWRRLGGGFIRVRFPVALCTKYGIVGKDKAEGQIPVEIEARLPVGADLTATPYYLDVIDA